MKALVCLFLVGCAADSLTLGDTESFIGKNPGEGFEDDGGCPTWGCGSNSPVIEALPFWDLDENGSVNAQGYKIVGFSKYWQNAQRYYKPDVVNGELVARNLATGQIVHQGYGIQNARFEIVNVNNGKTYWLRVASVGHMDLWAKPLTYFGSPPGTYTYNLRWTFPNPPAAADTSVPICGANTENDGMEDFKAVLFDDDRIDAEELKVTGTTPGWFNIGCAGHALAKQHLTGHTKAAAQQLLWTTTIAERTANLKMITGDYLGIGAPFTVAGQPLMWRDEDNYYNSTTMTSVIPMSKVIEARWTENGASCLNIPRVDYRWTQMGEDTFPAGVEDLLAPGAGWVTPEHPRPPPCTGSYNDNQGAHTVSVNYKYRLIYL